MTKTLKLNYRRTAIIGFAFFGITLLWQVYDSWCPTLLTELFKNAFHITDETEVQYLVGIMMAIDNLAALVLLPIFGNLSDKTKSPLGKRMPYILIGTFISAVAFPFIPVFFHNGQVALTLITMALVVCSMMMYRNPAVALMPDLTPKPLRSKANGIINIMGYIGGLFATVTGIVFVLSNYINGAKIKGTDPVQYDTSVSSYHNLWVIEAPFLIASVLMVISAVFLFIKVKENKIIDEMKEEMELGESLAEVVDHVEEDGPMSSMNKRMLLFILAAEFFWFMADNGIGTFMNNYTIYYLGASTASNMVNTIVGGVGSVIGFAVGGNIAANIGRKKTVVIGLGSTLGAYALWLISSLTFLKGAAGAGSFPVIIYVVWFLKGVGMSLVHLNSFPMVVELCPNSKIGKFTGYYYAASMAAQTITPIALGSLLLLKDIFNWGLLPVYALVCLVISFVLFTFVPNVDSTKTRIAKGLEAFDSED